MCIAKAQSGTGSGSSQTAEEIHDEIGGQVADCMKAAGYRHDMSDAQCLDDVDFNSNCYIRRRHGMHLPQFGSPAPVNI